MTRDGLDGAQPAAVVALHQRALAHAGRGAVADLAAHRANAAAAFHQAGVHCQRALLLREILLDFERGRTPADPTAAALALVDDPDLAARAARHYDIASAFVPAFAEPCYNRAGLARRAGELEAALERYQHVLTLAPHPDAVERGFLHANAAWESARLAIALGRPAAARAMFAAALARLDSYGPDHRILPDYLDRLDDIEAARPHFERVMRYSHRYAPEFAEPAFGADARLPQHAAGRPFDPLSPTPVDVPGGRAAVYFLHLYFRIEGAPAACPSAAQMVAAIDGAQPAPWTIAGCAPRLGEL